jgi:N-acetyl-gamma-glutamyl-phosphate reductase
MITPVTTGASPALLHMQAPTAAATGTCTEQVRVAVLGASGYTGEEVVRLLSLHPTFKVTALTGDRQAGKVRHGRVEHVVLTSIDAPPTRGLVH